MAAKTEEEPVLERHAYRIRRRRRRRKYAHQIKVTSVKNSIVDEDSGVLRIRITEAANVLRLGVT